jgi:thioredoxin reductase (NADPH)
MYDLIIIGSGPAGLAAAIYGIRGGLNLLVLESNALSGGQVLTTYEVDNYPGMPETDGYELGMMFRKHADKLGVQFKTAKVISIEYDTKSIANTVSEKKEINEENNNCKSKKILVHTKKESYETKSVILAMGASHAMLGIPGEAEFTGRGVSYCATCDGAFYRGKTAAVVGGGDVALEDAIYLSDLCEKVYLIHRRHEFRGAHILQKQLFQRKNIEILYGKTMEEICGQDTVDSVILKDINNGNVDRLDTDAVFVAVGIKPNSELINNQEILDENGYVKAGEDCITQLSGIFAAGDIRRKPLRQIVTAVADGANAANSAIAYCHGN